MSSKHFCQANGIGTGTGKWDWEMGLGNGKWEMGNGKNPTRWIVPTTIGVVHHDQGEGYQQPTTCTYDLVLYLAELDTVVP